MPRINIWTHFGFFSDSNFFSVCIEMCMYVYAHNYKNEMEAGYGL